MFCWRSNNRCTSHPKFSIASATERSDVLTDNQSNQLSLCAGYHGSRCHDNSSPNSLIVLQNSNALVLFECLFEQKFNYHWFKTLWSHIFKAENLSYGGLKALEMDETKARHYKTSIILNDHVWNVRFSSAKCIFFRLTVLPSLYYLYAIVRNTVEASLFLSSVPVTRLPLIAAHFCGECLHMRAPTCANGTVLLEQFWLLYSEYFPSVLSFCTVFVLSLFQILGLQMFRNKLNCG